MENAVVVREVSVNAEQIEAEPLEQAKPELSEWVIRRPKRKTVTEEEALKWTESFAAERKEPFVAAIRKSRG